MSGENPWNRCESCGRFIPHVDFELGLARRVLIEPDNAFGPEQWETTCYKHTDHTNPSPEEMPCDYGL